MAQVRFGVCIEKGERPELVAPWIGSFDVDRRGNGCFPCDEKPRRWDDRILSGPTPSFGSGVPIMNSSHTCWRSGIGQGKPRVSFPVDTPEGIVNLPRQDPVCTENLTVASLELARDSLNTRHPYPPLRYYP